MPSAKHYLPRSLIVLGVAEFAVLCASVYIAKSLRHGAYVPPTLVWDDGVLSSLLFASVLLAMLVSMGLYDRRALNVGVQDILPQVLIGYAMGLVVLAVVYWLAPSYYLGRGEVALAFGISFLAILLLRHFSPTVTCNKLFQHRILVLGSGLYAERLGTLVEQSTFPNVKLLGFVSALGEKVCVDRARLLEKRSTLYRLALENGVDEIVVALEERRDCVSMEEVLECRTHSIKVTSGSEFVERESGSLRIEGLLPSHIIFSDGFNHHRFSERLKRLNDIVISSVLAVLTAPIGVLTAVAIWIEDGIGAPIFYVQKRVGKDGRTFKLIKFRSMILDAEGDGVARWAQVDDDRVTCVGRVIRALRVDEIPQLFNVLRGEMSLVGPRPERPEFVRDLIRRIPYYPLRHSVKPGITGWAQVRYRYGASEEDAREKLQYDLYYVKHYSVLFDVLVLLQTAHVILWRSGAR